MHTRTGPDQGTALVSIDDGEPDLVDLYRATIGGDQVVYQRHDLEPGEHTLTVEVTGEHHDDSIGSWVTLDRITPLAVPPPFDPGGPSEVLPDGRLIYDDAANQCGEDSAIQYAGTWQSEGASGPYNRTRHISRTAGSYAELAVLAAVLALVSHRFLLSCSLRAGRSDRRWTFDNHHIRRSTDGTTNVILDSSLSEMHTSDHVLLCRKCV